MTLDEYKSTEKYGRSKLHFNYIHVSDPMRLSIHERRYEKRFEEGAKELTLINLEWRLDVLVAGFVIDFDLLTKAGGDIPALLAMTGNQQASVNYVYKIAKSEILRTESNYPTNFGLVVDMQKRAQGLLKNPARLIRLQCANKWWCHA